MSSPCISLTFQGSQKNDAVNESLRNREEQMKMLKWHLERAQHRMSKMPNRCRKEVTFDMGDWVYLKL